MRFIVGVLALSAVFAAPLAVASSQTSRSFSDVQSMTLRTDGKYDVVCKNGDKQVVTAEQIHHDEVCGGGAPHPSDSVEAVFARVDGRFFVLCKNHIWQLASSHQIEEGLVCTGGVEYGAFAGYATWNQDAHTQSDYDQDNAMDIACGAAFPGSRAATGDEIGRGVSGMHPNNDSQAYLTPKCPACEGNQDSSMKSGHERLCYSPGSKFGIPDNRTCYQSSRSAMCIHRDPAPAYPR